MTKTFKVGDCVILNYSEQPCAHLVAVVTDCKESHYLCQYLDADPMLDSYCNPPMKSSLDRATLVEDFGVKIEAHDGKYWCEQIEESKATYNDGKPRKWQERAAGKRTPRPHLADLLWPC